MFLTNFLNYLLTSIYYPQRVFNIITQINWNKSKLKYTKYNFYLIISKPTEFDIVLTDYF